MELKVKKLNDKSILPVRAHKGDAGLDMFVTEITTELNECGQITLVYHTGIAVEIPDGYVGILCPRSSIWKKSLIATNSVGIIDSGYRGEIMFKMRSTTDVVPSIYNPGDKFCQLLIVPCITDTNIVECEELSESERGESGYGSTDIKNEEDTTENVVNK